MKSSLKEELGRLGPVKGVDRVSGSPQHVTLRKTKPGELADFKAVEIAYQLARRGLSLASARQVVDEIIAGNSVVVELPLFDGVPNFLLDLFDAGVTIAEAQAADEQLGAAVLQLNNLINEMIAHGMPAGKIRTLLEKQIARLEADTSPVRKKA